MSTVAQRFKAFRIAVGLTQREIAAICGVGKRSIIYWEMNQREIGIQKLVPLADEYDLNFNWLLLGVGDMFLTHPLSKDPAPEADQ